MQGTVHMVLRGWRVGSYTLCGVTFHSRWLEVVGWGWADRQGSSQQTRPSLKRVRQM